MSEPYRCARERRCAEAVDEGGRVRGAALERADGLCPTCLRHVERALEDLPRDYVHLELQLATQRRCTERVTGTPDPAVPIGLDVLDLQAAIDAALSCWVEPVAEQLGIDWDTATMASQRPGPRLTRAARILAPHVAGLVNLGPVDVLGWCGGPVSTTRTGTEGALELLDLHHRARLMITGGTGDTRLPLPCPQCEGTLVRRNGLSHVMCLHCAGTWPEVDYQRLCLVLAADYRGVAA